MKRYDGETVRYGYDNFHQLIRLTYPDVLETRDESFLYGFDANGNRVKFENDFGNINYGYENYDVAKTNNINSVIKDDVRGESSLEYDYQGNQISSDKKANDLQLTKENRTYNELNEMMSYTAERPDGNTITSNYLYDSKGWRVKKQVGTAEPTNYIYEGVNVLCEKSETSDKWDYHLYLGLKKIADIKGDGTVEYYLTDHLGTVNACLNDAGDVTQRYTFGPYGNMEFAEGKSDNRYLFQGKELDGESGDYYFGARYYDAEAGRWLGRDKKEQFFSSYNAFGNNPMKYIDPDGDTAIELMFGLIILANVYAPQASRRTGVVANGAVTLAQAAPVYGQQAIVLAKQISELPLKAAIKNPNALKLADEAVNLSSTRGIVVDAGVMYTAEKVAGVESQPGLSNIIDPAINELKKTPEAVENLLDLNKKATEYAINKIDNVIKENITSSGTARSGDFNAMDKTSVDVKIPKSEPSIKFKQGQ